MKGSTSDMEVSSDRNSSSLEADTFIDIEDMLKTIAFIKGHKWTSMMVKRVYFGNWLREYASSQIYFLLFDFIAFMAQAETVSVAHHGFAVDQITNKGLLTL